MALATRPKPPTHLKKRQGAHHRHSKEYLKAYWPYIPMLGIVGLGIAINSFWYGQQQVLGTQRDFSSSSLLQATNQDRQQSQEPVLNLNLQLSTAAQAKANDMVQHNYWSHNSPDGQTPWNFITNAGYNYQLAGENLAYGFTSAQAVITGWMNSSEHRANMLNSAYSDVGFGVASATNFQDKGPETVVVAEYGEPSGAVANISFTVNNPAPQVKASEIAAQPVSRIQLMTGGQAAWSALAVSALAGALAMFFIIRHGLRLRKLVFQGEYFIINHPLLDIAIVFVITAGFVLTRSSGIIR